MRFLPFRTLTVRCDEPPDRVAHRIASSTRPRGWTLRVPEGTFFGETDGNRFRVLLDPPGAYSPKGARFFHPSVAGRIEPEGDGCLVQVRLRPVWSDLLAAALTVGIFSIAAGVVATGVRGPAAAEGREPSGWVRLGVAALCAGWLTWYVTFLARRFRVGVQEATIRIERVLGSVTQGDTRGAPSEPRTIGQMGRKETLH